MKGGWLAVPFVFDSVYVWGLPHTIALSSSRMDGGNLVTEMCTAAANFIINKVNEANHNKSLRDQIIMSSKRLQKLLYFSDVLYMVEHKGNSMFNDDFYAWPSGPVIPSVYRKFMQYQDGKMIPYSGELHDKIDSEMESTISRVLDATKSIDTNVLINESHVKGGPWHSVYDENDTNYSHIVDKKKIFDFYSKHGAPYGCRTNVNI